MRLIEVLIVILLVISLISMAPFPSSATYPTSFGNPYPPTLYGEKGSVRGTVVLSTNYTGVHGCYIAIVNAFNRSEEYVNTTTDMYGRFEIHPVNITYSLLNQTGDPVIGDGSLDAGINAYVLYANTSPYGEAYSRPFGINYDLGYTLESVIFPVPGKMTLTVDPRIEHVNGTDIFKVSAHVVGDADTPVNGTVVDFSINASDWTYRNGSLNANNSRYATATTVNGIATVYYGWFPENKLPNQSEKIVANLRDYHNINDTLDMIFTGATMNTSAAPSSSTVPGVTLAVDTTLHPTIAAVPTAVVSTRSSTATRGPKATPLSSEIAAMSIIIGMAIAAYSAGKKK